MNTQLCRTVMLSTVFLGYLLSPAYSAEIVDWHDNRTDVTHVVEFLSDRLRLESGFNAGSLSGHIALPQSGVWQIEFSGMTDESVEVLAEFIRTFVNGELINTTFNTPPMTPFNFDHQITGNSFDYRFDFSSPSIQFDEHMILFREGTVTLIPEPSSLAILAIGGTVLLRRRVG